MKKVLLRDICKIEKGKQIDTNLLDATNKYKYINGGIKESGMYFKFNTNANTVIVSEGGVSCGYVNYVEENFWCGCHCYRLLNPTIEPKYLYYVLKGNQKKIMDLKTGAAMPNIKKSSFQSLVLSIDNNKKHQDEIIYNLDKISSTIKLKTNQLILLDELIKSRFNELFSNGNYPIIKMSELSSKITKGSTPTTYGFDFKNEGINFIKIESLTDDHKFIKEKFTYVGDDCHESFKRSQLQCGDVLFSIAGALGRTAIVSDDILPANTNQALAIIRGLDKEKISKTFLLSEFETDFVKEQLERDVVGVAQKNLSLQNIQDLMIILPPLSEQQMYECFVNQVDKLKFIVQEQINNLQELFDKKMDEYFGE